MKSVFLFSLLFCAAFLTTVSPINSEDHTKEDELVIKDDSAVSNNMTVVDVSLPGDEISPGEGSLPEEEIYPEDESLPEGSITEDKVYSDAAPTNEVDTGVAGDGDVSTVGTCNNPLAGGIEANTVQTCSVPPENGDAGAQNQSFSAVTRTVDNTDACTQTSLGPASTSTRYLPAVSPQVESRVVTITNEEGVAADEEIARPPRPDSIVTVTRTLTDTLQICRPTLVTVSSLSTVTSTISQISDSISTVVTTVTAEAVVTGVQEVVATVFVQEFFTRTVAINSVAMVQQDIESTATVKNTITSTQTSYVTVSFGVSPDSEETVTVTETTQITRVVTPSNSPVEGVLGDSASEPTPCDEKVEPGVANDETVVKDYPAALPEAEAAATSPCDEEEPALANGEETGKNDYIVEPNVASTNDTIAQGYPAETSPEMEYSADLAYVS